MRRCHAQPTQLPIQLAGFRMRHATNELKRVAHFKWQVNSIEITRGERSVVNPRRQRMTDRLTHDAKYLGVRIDVIDPIEVTQIFRSQLARSSPAFFFKRSIG